MQAQPVPPESKPESPVRPVSQRVRRRTAVAFVAVLAIVGGAVAVGVLAGVIPNPIALTPRAVAAPASGEKIPTVKAVRPRPESAVPITIEQLATVEPYYRADLRARVSGIVKSVARDIGDEVRVGEVLVVIDVPELQQDVAKAEATIVLREQELKVSQAKVKDAHAAKAVAVASIQQREADVVAAMATRDLKKRKFERYKTLAQTGSVVGSVVEEEERDYLASEASVTSAKAHVARAHADLAEADAKIEAAMADVDLKRAQIAVATKDFDRARAVADFSKVAAPFDGVVVRRTIDPGSFVQNATSGASEALISIAKVDLVTVSARFPDAVAPSIAERMPALVTVDDLPGVSIQATVTRFAPSVQNADRTMRVEVDLFNGTDADHRRLTEAIKLGGPSRPTKGVADPLPVRAFPAGSAATRRLIPGMTGTIRLTTGGFGKSFVLPNTAVFSRSGTSYILVVKDGKTKQVPVRVQVSDGKTVRLALLDSNRGSQDGLAELNGQELVVVARQLEIGDGAAVKVGLSEW